MKEAMWGYLLVSIGVLMIVTVLIFQNMTATSEEDYYLVKEVMEASMLDAIDYGRYRDNNEIIMIKEKFVESFIRRFSESVGPSKTYKIDFYEVYETPPKASVRITTSSGSSVFTGDSSDFDIVTLLNGIIESK